MILYIYLWYFISFSFIKIKIQTLEEIGIKEGKGRIKEYIETR
jgi:hypothetical protein